MITATLVSWFLAIAAISWMGGVLLGLRIGRHRPSRKALERHDEAVAVELHRMVRELADERKDVGHG